MPDLLTTLAERLSNDVDVYAAAQEYRHCAFADQPNVVAAYKRLCEVIAREVLAVVAESAETQELQNLLAVIHRDGGHYVTKHELLQSIVDAEKVVCADRNMVAEALPTREEIAEMCFQPHDTEDALSLRMSAPEVVRFAAEFAETARAEQRERDALHFSRFAATMHGKGLHDFGRWLDEEVAAIRAQETQ